MKFEEVFPALREGEKIKRKIWYEDINYIILNENKEIISLKWGIYDALSIKDLLADDWEIVKEPKKVKLRDLTEEQYQKWILKNCDNYDDKCEGCPFQKVYCDRNPNIDDWWIRNKDLYSDKFLDQEIEIYE